MEDNNFVRIFAELGISFKPLDDHYDPDDFGRALRCDYNRINDISYASETEVIVNDYVVNDGNTR